MPEIAQGTYVDVIILVTVFKIKPIQRYVPSIQLNLNMSTDASGPIKTAITEALAAKLDPIHLEVVNESYMHNVPTGSETHFKVLVVSEKFESLPLIKVKKKRNKTKSIGLQFKF